MSICDKSYKHVFEDWPRLQQWHFILSSSIKQYTVFQERHHSWCTEMTGSSEHIVPGSLQILIDNISILMIFFRPLYYINHSWLIYRLPIISVKLWNMLLKISSSHVEKCLKTKPQAVLRMSKTSLGVQIYAWKPANCSWHLLICACSKMQIWSVWVGTILFFAWTVLFYKKWSSPFHSNTSAMWHWLWRRQEHVWDRCWNCSPCLPHSTSVVLSIPFSLFWKGQYLDPFRELM